MGGYFAAVSKEDCVFDLFFGVDYHSHLGTRRAGMAVYDPETGFDKAIHNIEKRAVSYEVHQGVSGDARHHGHRLYF